MNTQLIYSLLIYWLTAGLISFLISRMHFLYNDMINVPNSIILWNRRIKKSEIIFGFVIIGLGVISTLAVIWDIINGYFYRLENKKHP